MLTQRHALSSLLGLASFAVSGSAGAVPGRAVDLDSSYGHSCAVTSCGDLVCWGRNDYGQANDHVITSSNNLHPPKKWTDVSTGFHHTCGIKEDGKPACWGSNAYGQLDLPLTSDVHQITAGGYHTCEMRGTGEVWCAGYDGQGQASPPAEFFFDISAGAYHTCGIRPGGDVLCWGDDSYGQSYGHEWTPGWAMFPGEEFVDVEAGTSHTCAVTDYGSVYCWGSGAWGQLHPALDVGAWGEVLPNFWRYIGDHEVLDVGANGNCTLSGTSIECWGSPFTSGGVYTPPIGLSWDDIALGSVHACGYDTSGAVTCWGSGSYGKTTPDPITGGSCPFYPIVPFDPTWTWGG